LLTSTGRFRKSYVRTSLRRESCCVGKKDKRKFWYMIRSFVERSIHESQTSTNLVNVFKFKICKVNFL